jgi:hypothetical protein
MNGRTNTTYLTHMWNLKKLISEKLRVEWSLPAAEGRRIQRKMKKGWLIKEF